MKKYLTFLFAAVLLTANIFVFTQKTNANIPPSGLMKGLKGTYQGVFICHCPDDNFTCYCGI